MDDREKLVNLLRTAKYNVNGNTLGQCYFDSCLEMIANHLIANGVTVQRWIPVTERLPEDFEEVLICSVIGGRYVAQHLRGFFYSAGVKIGTSHWMPLPEPPKEGK